MLCYSVEFKSLAIYLLIKIVCLIYDYVSIIPYTYMQREVEILR